jgi:hypothetical protein
VKFVLKLARSIFGWYWAPLGVVRWSSICGVELAVAVLELLEPHAASRAAVAPARTRAMGDLYARI